MRCPKCDGANVYVIDSREKDGMTYRRRECTDCGNRFSTNEVLAEDFAVLQGMWGYVMRQLRRERGTKC